MKERYPNLARDIALVPTIELENGYLFKAYSVGERGCNLKPQLIREVVYGLVEKIRQFLEDFDYLVTVQLGGSAWGLAVAFYLEKSLKTIWERGTGFEDEFKVHHKGSYHDRDLFFRGFRPGDKVIFLDDVLSTGITASLIISTLQEHGVIVKGAFFIITKGDSSGKIEKEYRVPVHSLINLPQL
jgi:adenine/guanine phosphoribosyltransferase-like PRPP-binding protein